MKKFLSTISIFGLFFPFLQVAKANEYKFFQTSSSIINGIPTVQFYKVSSSGTQILLNTWESSNSHVDGINANLQDARIDQYEGKIYLEVFEQICSNACEEASNYTYENSVIEYDFINNTAEKIDGMSVLDEVQLYPRGIVNMISENSDGSIQIGGDTNDIDIVEDGLNIDGDAVITQNSDGSIQIGNDEHDIDITSEGLSIDGLPLISKKDNGELHIGQNSWITKEDNGRQKVWARDEAGNAIPIDYTNGTKLLINGRDVEQSINNVGALSAALTGLPTVPTENTLACGLGTGTHGGDLAFSGGCASKINEKLSVNYAASITMPGQEYAGNFEDQFSARAGFVWKLGKAIKPTQISMKEGKELKKEIIALKENNQNIISQNKALLARLEKLEKIALSENKSKDLAIYRLK